ncbi:MAG TPA: hypothetical protein VLT51_07230, partial [Anaerolineales bacterium]|nr:hypothetical protein [Anaerolineales bacterium]
MNEADTCRTYVLPKLRSAGWEDEYIFEQMVLTPGRIVPIGDRHIRKHRTPKMRDEMKDDAGKLGKILSAQFYTFVIGFFFMTQAQLASHNDIRTFAWSDEMIPCGHD